MKSLYAERYHVDPVPTLQMSQESRLVTPRNKNHVNDANAVDDHDIEIKNGMIDDLSLSSRSSDSRPTPKIELAVPSPCVQDLLEIWTFFNVFLEVLILDSFTLDDFCDALIGQDNCELIDELFCSLLRVFSEARVLPGVTQKPIEQESDRPAGSTTGDLQNRSWDTVAQEHAWRGDFFQKQFSNDRYRGIILGLLDEWSREGSDFADTICNSSSTGSMDIEAIPDKFQQLSSENKINILKHLIEHIWRLPLIREYIEECMNHLTQLRKDRADTAKVRRLHSDAIYRLKLSRREQALASINPSEKPKAATIKNVDHGRKAQTLQPSDSSDLSEDDEMPHAIVSTTRSRASALSRVARVRADDEMSDTTDDYSRSVDREDSMARFSSHALSTEKDFEMAIAKHRRAVIRADDKIAKIEAEFRESDAQRLRKLGEDRFYNAYYWLEASGMPIFGLPNCSTSHAGFSTGRIFVQGPSQYRLEELRHRYSGRLSELEARRRKEEGSSTMLPDDQAWGYYDSPKELEGLLAWLNPKGEREFKLKSNIESRLENIVSGMENRMTYLAGGFVPERRSKRTHIADDLARYQCWRNTMARNMFGAPHSGERKVRGIAISKKRKR